MKDKRNYSNNMSYPIYTQPMMIPPYGLPANQLYQPNMFNNTIDQQLNNIERQLNSLEQRITRLENAGTNNTTNYTKYNDSNYYMV